MLHWLYIYYEIVHKVQKEKVQRVHKRAKTLARTQTVNQRTNITDRKVRKAVYWYAPDLINNSSKNALALLTSSRLTMLQ